MFYVNRAGNGNPPPTTKPKRSEVPVEQDPIDVPPAEVPPAQAQ